MNNYSQLIPEEIQETTNRLEKVKYEVLSRLQKARQLRAELLERIKLMHEMEHPEQKHHQKTTAICSICQSEYEHLGKGNNAEPVNSGECCDECDWLIVTLARMRIAERRDHDKLEALR